MKFLKNIYNSIVNFEGLDVILHRNLDDLAYTVAIMTCIFGFYLIIAGEREKGTKYTSLSFIGYIVARVLVAYAF